MYLPLSIPDHLGQVIGRRQPSELGIVPSLAKITAKLLQVIDKQFGLLEGGEVATLRQPGPANNVIHLLGPEARGRANFGRANGIGAMAAIPLLAGASALSHLLEGWTGSYATGFLVQVGLIGAGGLMLSLVTFPKHESEAA